MNASKLDNHVSQLCSSSTWVEAPLGEILPLKYGKSRSNDYGYARQNTQTFGSNGAFGTFDRALTNGPTIVVGRKGAAGAVHYSADPCWPIDTAFYSEGSQAFHLPFARHLLSSLQLAKLDKSTAIPSLSRDDYASTVARFPCSLGEQKRIVAKIEELFSELDKGIENLNLARAQLAVYRQALLKDVFEGKITADWRVADTNQLESGAALLARIRANQRNSSRRPMDVASDDLPVVPSEWAWARLDWLGDVGSGMSVSKDRKISDPVEVPYLRVANVQRGHLDLTTVKTMRVERSAVAELKLVAGDVLFNEGGDRDKLGRGWIWEGQIDPCITQNHVFRVRPIAPHMVSSKFISHWGNTFGQQFFLRHGKQTTNLASINKAVLSKLPVPLPSIEEQMQIVAHLEAHTTVIDAFGADIDANLQKAEALRQSILKRAFTGDLVPQDPNDEPAGALLARLCAEPAAAAAPKAKTRREPRVTQA